MLHHTQPQQSPDSSCSLVEHIHPGWGCSSTVAQIPVCVKPGVWFPQKPNKNQSRTAKALLSVPAVFKTQHMHRIVEHAIWLFWFCFWEISYVSQVGLELPSFDQGLSFWNYRPVPPHLAKHAALWGWLSHICLTSPVTLPVSVALLICIWVALHDLDLTPFLVLFRVGELFTQ